MAPASGHRGARFIAAPGSVRIRRLWALALLVSTVPIIAAGQRGHAAPPDNEAETGEDAQSSPYQSGLVARYTGADGVAHARREDALAFCWGTSPPDRRLSAGPFVAEFRGFLQIRSPGEHTLRVFAAGAVRITLAGKVILDASAAEPAWLDAAPIELDFGLQPFEVRYRRTDQPARLAVFWEGPQFELEPLAGRWLQHETAKTPSDAFERGARLVRALRCAACHDVPGEPPALAAPALDRLDGNLSRPWLVDWLTAAATKPSGEQSATRRMPHDGFQRNEAEAVADYLFAASGKIGSHRTETRSTPAPPAPLPPGDAQTQSEAEKPRPAPPSAAAGATLLRGLGCLACHRASNLGSDGLFGGGDLSHVAEKRPADFFSRWLTDPGAINRNHRMPVFALAADEAASLSLYLQTLGDNSRRSPPPAVATTRQLDARQLVREARCANCHALSEDAGHIAEPEPLKLDPALLVPGRGSCLDPAEPSKRRPGYLLSAADRQAVATFLREIGAAPGAVGTRGGEDLLVENNCLACHARGASPGLAANLPDVAQADASLSDLLAALVPPALAGVGDKLHDEALAASIAAADPPRHPWLRVRMPRFPLDEGQRRTLVQYFVDSDRIPDRPAKASAQHATSRADPAVEAAGARLVTADGFGCTSCHAIGKWVPQKVALAAQGTDLSAIGTRMRRGWFDRWVRNPARIVPQMEMPAVQQSVRGVLEGDLQRQLAAVWDVLNRPGFTPPNPAALRVVRRSNLPGANEPAAVLTDVVEIDGRPFVKPLLVGLPNRHNVLFDLATHRTAAWWTGDTAR